MYELEKNPDVSALLCNQLSKREIEVIAQDSINIGEDNDDKFLLYLFLQAINLVGKDYLQYDTDHFNEKKEDDGNESSNKNIKAEAETGELYLERTFAYELYRQWQNLLCLYNSSLRVDAEIGKKISNIGNLEKLQQIKCDRKEPDLVLHESQGNFGNQIIICEIKRSYQLSPTKIENDLIKICRYMDRDIWDGHPYKYGSFVVVDKDFDDLKKQINSIELNEYKNKVNFSNILVVAYNGVKVQFDTLNNILKI